MRKTAVMLGILAAIPAANAVAAETDAASSWWQAVISDVELRPTIGISTGYNSNPEEEPDGQGSLLRRLDAGLRGSVGDEGETEFAFSADATFVDYVEESLPEDYEVDLEAELQHQLSEELELSFGADYERDGTDDPPTVDSELWGSIEADSTPVAWEFRGSVREYLEKVSREDREDDDFENFDYRAGSLRTRAELETGKLFRPVVEARVSLLDYLEQRPGTKDRDAVDTFVMAGAEADLTDDLRLQIGVRRNERYFEEPGDDPFASIFPDLEVEWDVSDKLRVELSLGRSFDEPGEEDGLVQDEIEARVELAYKPNDKLTLEGEAAVKRTEEIGTDYDKFEWEAALKARYELHKQLALILEAGTLLEERRDDPDEDFTRSIVRAGLEATF